MNKNLLGLGFAITLALSGCAPSGSETPATPAATSTTVSQRAMDNEVASVDLSDTEQSGTGRTSLPGDGGVVFTPGSDGRMTADGNDGTVARTDDGLPDQNDMVSDSSDVASRGTDIYGNTAMGVETMALEGNVAEQRLSALALERSDDPEVKKAAQMIQKDHKQAERRLRGLPGSSLPAKVELNAEHQNLMAKLEGLDGKEFDKAYVNGMVAGHEKTLAFYQAQAKEAPSDELKGYFAGNSAMIQEHLEHCKKLQINLN